MACIPCLSPLTKQRRRMNETTPAAPTSPAQPVPAYPISAVSAAALGLHAINKLCRLLESIRDAPKEIQDVLADTRSIRDTLVQLKLFLDDDAAQVSSELVQSLHIPLENTFVVTEELVGKIKPFIAEDGELKRSKLMGMKWFSYQKDVKQLGLQLSNGKSTLNMALAVINVIKTSEVRSDTLEIINYLRTLNLEERKVQSKAHDTVLGNEVEPSYPDSRMKDMNYAMTRFLETASTVVGSPPHSPWITPTDIAQVSTFEDDLSEENDPRVEQPVCVDNEGEIRRLLARSTNDNMNEDGHTALHLAAMQDAYLTREVLTKGNLDVNTPNMDGDTALMCATSKESKEVVALLLRHGAKLDPVNEKMETCLHIAASTDTTGKLTEMLLRRYQSPPLEAVNDVGFTPLLSAAFYGNEAVTRLLLDHGAAQEPGSGVEFTALHCATMQANHTFMARLLNPLGPDFEAFYEAQAYGISTKPQHDTIFKRRLHIVRMLLDHGADVHASGNGITPLHIAVVTAQEEIVKTLLEHGAIAEGVVVLCAYWGLSPETVKVLLARGANVNATDSRWHKPALTWEAEVGSPETIRHLIQHGADVHHRDLHASALHYAAANVHKESVKILLEAGADPNLLDHQNKNVLNRLAASKNRFYLAGRWWNCTPEDQRDIAIVLCEAGCDPDAKDHFGRAAIHYAASSGYLSIIEVIVDRGADWELKDERDMTPLRRAQDTGELDVVRFLKRQRFLKERGGQKSGRSAS